MSGFKVGDTVICIDPGEDNGLEENKEYVIESIEHDIIVVVDDRTSNIRPSGYLWRFKLKENTMAKIQVENKFQVGDVWENNHGLRVAIKAIDPEPSNVYPIYGDNSLSYTQTGELWYNERTNQDLVKLISREGNVKSTEQSGKTPRKHAELIKAWADGAEIEFYSSSNECWIGSARPDWLDSYEYRVKPEAPVSRWLNVYDPMLDHMPTPVWCNSSEKSNGNAVSGRIAVIEDKQDGTPWILHQL